MFEIVGICWPSFFKHLLRNTIKKTVRIKTELLPNTSRRITKNFKLVLLVFLRNSHFKQTELGVFVEGNSCCINQQINSNKSLHFEWVIKVIPEYNSCAHEVYILEGEWKEFKQFK